MAEKRIAIMQPYFFPYIGYFHLLDSVDSFVLYDNIKYTKRGWINRNRYLDRDHDEVFSIPLKKASDSADVDQRELAPEFDRGKLLRKISASYRRAPHFDFAFELFSTAVEAPEVNLFQFIKRSLRLLCESLEIGTPIVDSSSIAIDHSLRGQEKVLAICESLHATTYINAIGGIELYNSHDFASQNVKLRFIQSQRQEYEQFGHPFVPWLSILDLLMFNHVEQIRTWVHQGYDVVAPTAAGP